MLRCTVLKSFTSHLGAHAPGESVDADQFHNSDALVSQRYLRPVGDTERFAALEARLAGIEAQVRQLQSERGRKGG